MALIVSLRISNEEIVEIMKVVKSLVECGLLIIGISKTIKNKGKKQKGGFLRMLLGTSGAKLLGNLLTSNGAIRVGQDF